MKQSILFRVILFLGIYFGLRYYGGDIGKKILYPIMLLVTYLHEFGHALGSLLTGGEVVDIEINQFGGGATRTRGGNRAITIMGGYLGSALFGNILFLIGAKAKPLVKPILALLAISMLFTAVIWYKTMFTSGFLILFALAILLIIWKTNFGREILLFLGLATILYIIQDFRVGPSSDLKAYADHMKILPANVWMYIWLALAVLLFLFNLKIIFTQTKNEIEEADFML